MNFFDKNLATCTDSYKASHSCQFPNGTTHTSYYIEARTENEELIAAGMNFVAKVLEQGITITQVERANLIYRAHFGREIFNYTGWMKIATEFMGILPIKLIAVQEGTLVPSKNAIAVVENTHEEYPWLPGHLETFILRGIWYPTSVATKSYQCKKILKTYLEQTTDLKDEEFDFVLNTRLHDFGARGATSEESAAIGGLAHLYNFIGTDTVEAMVLAQDMYGVVAAGISVPAREHSTTISYQIEDDAYLNSIQLFGEGTYSCVMDSTDYNAAVTRVCETMKEKIINKGGTFVFRPDSGDMIQNIMFTLETLGKHFGYERNSKGYRVLDKHVRILQGDDINDWRDINRVLSWMEMKKWSAENIVFGMGGGLLQKVNRDTHKFAMKLSAIKIDGEWHGVHKCPKGAEWKASKKGKLRLTRNVVTNECTTVDINNVDPEFMKTNLIDMVDYFDSGTRPYADTLCDIRHRINATL